ncbi:DUF433 domain-containing protein [Phytoactinopolyspora limicola]|uniref:DUF433 domain-containing protein n=1 Tax=Phytoactinopolyspora limicola TaxID=2715536 RepID=UPI00140937DB|nr:DUF433 domain-containing protein [Phytoactinopolyspora limicola]
MTSLRRDLGDEYILASEAIATDGVDVLVKVAEGDEWRRARVRQGGIRGVIELGIEPIKFAADGYPERIKLTGYQRADVIIDPRFGFGQPIEDSSGVRVEDIVDLFEAGEPISVVSEEFGVDERIVDELVRVHLRRAA